MGRGARRMGAARVSPLAALLALAGLGCHAPEHTPPPDPRVPTVSEPIEIEAEGGRARRLRCAGDCDGSRRELDALRLACSRDPLSLAASVGGRFTTLGCCEEAERTYTTACEDPLVAPCVRRWLAECEAASPAAHPPR